jgi:hypothetical protein
MQARQRRPIMKTGGARRPARPVLATAWGLFDLGRVGARP